MSSTQTSAENTAPINQQTTMQKGNEETHYMYVNPEVQVRLSKTYEFIFEDAGEKVELTGHDYDNGDGTFATLYICPLDSDDHQTTSDKNAKALKQVDELLYDTTYNFYHENPAETAIRILNKENGNFFDQTDVSFIVSNMVRSGHLPKTKANCGDLFKIVSLDAKLRSGSIIRDGKIKGTEIALENGLFIRDLVMRNRIRIKKAILQVDNWQVICDSNDSFMNAINDNDGINLQIDTRIGYQLKALKERAEFIQADLDLEFESGSIKLDDKNFIIFKDNEINFVDTAKGKKRVISPFALFIELNEDEYAPEIMYNPEGLLKKGDNNNFITLKYNQKRHDLSTIDGIKNRIMQTLSEAYNKNLKRDIDKLLKLVRAINNTTEDIDAIMSPWTQIKQSQEAQPKNTPNKPEANTEEAKPVKQEENNDTSDLA